MELVELHVGNLGSGAPSHGDAVAGRNCRIRRIAVDLSRAATRQQHSARSHPRPLAVAIEQANTGNRSVLNQQVRGRRPLQQRDLLDGPRMAQERPANFRPRCVAVRVENAIAAVRALARQHQLATFAVEVRAPAQQLLDPQRPFLHQHPRRFAIHQAIASIHRVVQMQRNVFLAAHRNGDSTLCIVGVRFVERFLRHHQHPGPRRACSLGWSTRAPSAARPIAARSPAIPAPTITKSVSSTAAINFQAIGFSRAVKRCSALPPGVAVTLRNPLRSAESAASATPAAPDAQDARHTRRGRRDP